MRMSMTKEELSIEEAFDQFIKRCEVKNYSKETIKTYNTHFHVFNMFVPCKSLNDISQNILDEFVLYLKERCSDITINSYLRTIRSFLYYCMEMGYLSKFKIDKLKVQKTPKKIYSKEELRLLLRKPNIKTCSFSEFKMWAFSNFLLGTGVRLSSALNIKLKDLDFEDMVIYVSLTKNNKPQIIPMSNSLYNTLQEYLIYRKGEPDDYVFCNSYGEKGQRRSYQEMLNKYNRSRGVESTGSHRYRHTFAKNWILNGGDIFRLQKILGHSDLGIVREYVEMFDGDLGTDFEKFNPLDNFSSIKEPKKRIRIRK